MSTNFVPSRLLRNALFADAAASGGMGLLLTFASDPLTALLGLPQPLLLGAGFACLGWAAFVGLTGRRATVGPVVVWAILAFNGVWVVESLLMLLLGWVQPTTLGMIFVIAQALTVLALAEAQFIGLRRSTAGRVAV